MTSAGPPFTCARMPPNSSPALCCRSMAEQALDFDRSSTTTHHETMSQDIFADIGTRTITERRGQLEELQPQKLPRKLLPAEKSAPAAAFKPARRMDTPEQLQAELVRQRKRYQPFLQDLAPELPSLRTTQRLEHFQWRMETAEDRSDFQHPLTGAGEWDNITVPHFSGPIGRAVSYYRTTFTVT